MTTTKRTLDELTIMELIESARSELMGLDARLAREGKLGGIEKAYLGSIGARLVVAEIKVKEEA